MQLVKSQGTLSPESQIHNSFWVFSLTSHSAESCMGKADQQSVRGYLHPKELSAKPLSYRD